MKNKPVAALPWSIGPATTLEGNRLGIKGIWTEDKKTGVAEAFGYRENAAYIVHAANAYPELIEALREARTTIWHMSPDDGPLAKQVERIDALLRELGELA